MLFPGAFPVYFLSSAAGTPQETVGSEFKETNQGSGIGICINGNKEERLCGRSCRKRNEIHRIRQEGIRETKSERRRSAGDKVMYGDADREGSRQGKKKKAKQKSLKLF